MNCRNKKPLPFDFYLPELNICIEYDGIQHYKTWKGKQADLYIVNLQKTKQHDLIKTNFCKDNGIRLIRIPYTIKSINEHLNFILPDMFPCQELFSG
jgi:very-short-patch-repair endonuclease